MYNELKKAIGDKTDKDIAIIGKGPSIDEVELSLLDNCIVINTNDSELIYPGDIAVFHHGWVLDTFDETDPKCDLYISDKTLPPGTPQIQAEYIPYTPESAGFLLDRFFSDTLYVEHAIIVTALRVANEIAKGLGQNKNVYLLGFDFTTQSGFTKQIPGASLHNDPEYQERIIKSQEQLLDMLMAVKHQLKININHVGSKPYSVYSVKAFNKVFSTRVNGIRVPAPKARKDKKDPDPFQVRVVAEITTNHFGDMDRLKSMIVAAKNAGADYIKLQKRDVENFYSEKQLNAFYNSPFGKTFRDYRHGIELSQEQFEFVDSLCKRLGIGWFVSTLDKASYDFIKQFDPEMVKLPSTISEYKDFLSHVAGDFKKDVVISTGFTDVSYEKFILDTFKNVRNIYLLQCTSAYPTKNEDAQIGVVRHYYNLSKKYKNIIPGYSSHDIGSICCMMAVAAGAKYIEKHVKFGDVSWSHFDEVAVDLVNGDFDKFVADIRDAETILGSEIKQIHSTEHHKY